MLILYITYVDMEGANSGSGVRPRKMYEAFLEEGHEVKLLSGSQQRWDRKKRTAAVKEIQHWLDTNRPDICYIESPSNPILFRCDIALIRRLHRLHIPTGYFYRDFYWKFPELYPPRRDPVGRLKELWLSILQRRTDRTLRRVDIVYLPSEECFRYFDYADMRALPPAGMDCVSERTPEEKTCIYVGGLGGGYGVEMLLAAFARLNEGGGTYRLIFVCRKNEWDSFVNPWKNAPWLELHHVSGTELEPLYARAALSVIPVRLTAYTHLAVNVKLFEYLGHGLPVVVTKARAISAFVRKYGIGAVVPWEEDALADAVREIADDPGKRKSLEKQCVDSLRRENLWKHRVRRVVSELEEKKS